MWDAAKQLAAQKLKGFASQLASVTSQEQLRLTDLTRLECQVTFASNSQGQQVTIGQQLGMVFGERRHCHICYGVSCHAWLHPTLLQPQEV